MGLMIEGLHAVTQHQVRTLKYARLGVGSYCFNAFCTMDHLYNSVLPTCCDHAATVVWRHIIFENLDMRPPHYHKYACFVAAMHVVGRMGHKTWDVHASAAFTAYCLCWLAVPG